MKRRNGFTLIELLVVIGIIMILVAMLVYGFRSMNRTAATKETHAELKVCKGMLAEYEGRNSLAGIEAFSNTNPIQQSDPGAPPQTPGLFPVYVDPATAIGPGNTTLVKPGAPGTWWPSLQLADVEAGGGSQTDMSSRSNSSVSPSPRYYSAAVPATLDAMYVLMRMPANQSLATTITGKRLLEPIPKLDQPTSPPPNPVTMGVVLLDGWGSPIIFVPRAGMHVNILRRNASGQMVPTLSLVRSTGTFDVSAGGDPPMSGSERPFFASAGQDGDFTAGDDNVYSFQE